MCRRLVLPLLLGLLLVAAALPVNAEDESSGSWFSFSNLMSSAQNTFNRAVQTVQNAADEVVRFVVVQSTADQICFRILGCLSLKSPWVSLKRPVPRPDMPDAIDVRFYLYTREQPERFTVLSEAPLVLNGSTFNPQKRTFFVTHGFQNSGNETWMANLKDVLLDKVDGNVFLVDWGNGAMNPNYLKATSNTRVVGREIAWLARSLISEYGASAQQFHFMGHSLGAHISGYAARNVTNVARITAFDPAGPGFEALPRLVRLNKYMADFIDVIHTNAKPLTVFGFGMMHAIGHVDFYLNGGVDQPGCLTPDIDPPKSLLDIVALPLTAVSELLQCSHCRAYEYYTEALNNTSCRMWGHKVSVSKNRLLWRRGVPSPVEEKTGKCENGQCVPIGLDTIEFPARGTFSVVTNSKSPYCVEENSADGQSLEELKQLELL